ncbi:14767_t:CDS:2, partial [Gigaspora rosea]
MSVLVDEAVFGTLGLLLMRHSNNADRSLWDTYLPDLSEDFIYKAQQRGESAVPEDPLIVSQEMNFSQDELQRILEGVSLLNDEQRAVYDAVITVAEQSNPEHTVFSLMAL